MKEAIVDVGDHAEPVPAKDSDGADSQDEQLAAREKLVREFQC